MRKVSSIVMEIFGGDSSGFGKVLRGLGRVDGLRCRRGGRGAGFGRVLLVVTGLGFVHAVLAGSVETLIC